MEVGEEGDYYTYRYTGKTFGDDDDEQSFMSSDVG